jgi:hypothetical protein
MMDNQFYAEGESNYCINNEKDINWKWGIVEIKEGGAYSALLKLFTTKDEESGDFMGSNLELALKKKITSKNIRIKSILRSSSSTMVDGDISDMNSIVKRTFTTPVQGDDKEYDRDDFLTLQGDDKEYDRDDFLTLQGDDKEYDRDDFLTLLLVMYSKNKLVDFLTNQNLSSVDVTDISNGKENGKPKRSCKFRRIINSVGRGLRKMKHLFCCFSSTTVS